MSADRTFTFPTPNTIRLEIALQAARLELVASERSDTVVTVAARNPSRQGDLSAVQSTVVEFSDDRLSIIAPKRWSLIGPGTDTIVVTVELPEGSAVNGTIAYGNVRGTGRLGACRIRSSYGDLVLDETGAVELRTSSGNITVGAITGEADFLTSNGAIQVDLIDGSATAKTSNGDISIGEITGALQANVGSGGIRIDMAGTDTFAKIAYGNVRIGSAAAGSVRLEGAYGELEVGVPEGTAAWLDLSSGHGFVRNELTADVAPGPDVRTVEVRARVNWGDIVVRRPVARRSGARS